MDAVLLNALKLVLYGMAVTVVTLFAGFLFTTFAMAPAKAQSYQQGFDTEGHYEQGRYGSEYVPPNQLPNPDPAYSQPPISTVLQNEAFTAQSYRKGY